MSLFQTLLVYLAESQIKSTLNDIDAKLNNNHNIAFASTAEDSSGMDMQEDGGLSTMSWIPLSVLLKFKRIESIARSTEDIVNAVKTSQFPNLFEFNLPNCTQIRRLVAFDDIKLKNQYSNNPGNVVLLDFAAQTPDTLVSEHAVLALGFPVTTTEQEAWAHFSTYGSVKAVCLYQMQSGSENDNNDDDDEDALNGIDNDDRQRRKTGSKDLVACLIARHMFDDLKIWVQPKKVGGEQQQGNASTRPSRIRNTRKKPTNEESVFKNRLVRCLFQDHHQAVFPNTIKSLFEKFATVATAYVDNDQKMCLIRLKSSLADSVVGVIEKNGGLSISGKALNLQALTGDEERLMWEFLKEKVKQQPTTPSTSISPMKTATPRQHQQINRKKGGKKSRMMKTIQKNGNTKKLQHYQQQDELMISSQPTANGKRKQERGGEKEALPHMDQAAAKRRRVIDDSDLSAVFSSFNV